MTREAREVGSRAPPPMSGQEALASVLSRRSEDVFGTLFKARVSDLLCCLGVCGASEAVAWYPLQGVVGRGLVPWRPV